MAKPDEMVEAIFDDALYLDRDASHFLREAAAVYGLAHRAKFPRVCDMSHLDSTARVLEAKIKVIRDRIAAWKAARKRPR